MYVKKIIKSPIKTLNKQNAPFVFDETAELRLNPILHMLFQFIEIVFTFAVTCGWYMVYVVCSGIDSL